MKAKSICALCSVDLTDENKTKEHVIPNSIGGWEKVEGFICVTCNVTVHPAGRCVDTNDVTKKIPAWHASRARRQY